MRELQTLDPRREDILIVEDEALIALDLQTILLDAGHNVVGIAADCEAALAMADRHRPSVALVDLCLATDLDGLTLAHELERRHHNRVIFVTGTPDRLLGEGSVAMKRLLVKPVPPSELLSMIDDCADVHRPG